MTQQSANTATWRAPRASVRAGGAQALAPAEMLYSEYVTAQLVFVLTSLPQASLETITLVIPAGKLCGCCVKCRLQIGPSPTLCHVAPSFHPQPGATSICERRFLGPCAHTPFLLWAFPLPPALGCPQTPVCTILTSFCFALLRHFYSQDPVF